MWPMIAMGLLLLLVAVAAFWMGTRSSRSESAAAQAVMSAAEAVNRSSGATLDRAMEQARLSERIGLLENQVQEQTESASKVVAAVDRIESQVQLLLDTMAARGMVRRSPRQAGEVETTTTSPPPPLPASRIPPAKPVPRPADTPSSAPPTPTG
ncbi:MAG TPA: hypothetical protein P5234_15810 [Thermoanaerobaculaceae bacterium]|nr:hypothetical protein [Phycisphaerales bacterium]HRS17702.1 hypothetical protein [Thermoanaerobaculaceae bacterium]HRU10572.1 hypothetical protein [Thermoanaerobaculia bacterium]